MATNGTANHQELQSATTPTTEATASGGGPNNLSKDEVGWYFVEQYYTTLSKSPEKLHLFYGKQSQFVYGVEAELVNVSVGRPAIQDRIKALDFEDCKVRISNVDSQASHDNIVIQVIGETSNKAGEPKKFVQTFVLAQQPSGYFVLNDILRYINEEGEEEQEEVPEVEAPAPADEPEAPVEIEAEPELEVAQPDEPLQEQETVHLDTSVVDKKIEEVSATAPETPISTVATPVEPVVSEPEPTLAQLEPEEESVDPDPVEEIEEIAEEDIKTPEVPQDPTPTPIVPVAPTPVVAEPEKPKEPAKPMTWASRIAAAAGPLPPRPVALPKTATPPAQSKTPVPASSQQSVAPPPYVEAAPAVASSKDLGNEWQTAGSDSKRQNRPLSISAPPAEKEGTMAYIKYVTDKVKTDDLRAALAQHGELAYFDINRQKNCAFVEFATQAGYTAAVAANPHIVNGENIVVEQRRPKANAYGGTNYNTARGGPAGRGRGGFDGNRSGSQGGSRGGHTGQARGGRAASGTAPRGTRGASQAANA